tara:strand:- start:1223 stop:2002 length:780 start_codon:yes stop_codon:yes gene_type:complete
MISILLSTFNSEKTIIRSLYSILSSSFPDFELIVIDDGSKDFTKKLVLELSVNDNRFLVKSNSCNLGLAKSLNLAFSYAKHDYIARMDADDICKPYRLKVQLEYMLAHPEIDILGGNSELIDSHSNVIGKTNLPLDHDSIIKALEYRNPMVHPAVMMKREVLEKLGGYDERLRKAQDLDLWHRAAKAGFRFANLSDYLIQYRVDLNKSSKTILKGFSVSISHAIRNRSLKGVFFSGLDLVKYFIIKFKLYTPKSLRNRV